MLRILLDEHLSPRLVEQLARRRPEIMVVSLQGWEGGAHLQERDEALLTAAHAQRLTLLTYDQRTIVPLLKQWSEQGVSHRGVILVDDRAVPPNDIGGLIRAIERLWDAQQHLDWVGRVVYLAP
ncbi:MAG: DUF5615 family PIN-like protein [Armatimonadetes bacterium]|nr:DUF5615 family PIN-like protein [Armatimonadota bacterium]